MLAVGCSGGGRDPSPGGSPSPSPSPSGSPVEVLIGDTTAAEAMRRLCIPATIEADPVTKVPVPGAIREVESQVEAVRGLAYKRRVNVEPITSAEMDRRLRAYFDAYYPRQFFARRSRAWQTIGVLPAGVGYLEALDAYQQGQVLGFYNSQNEELVYTGDADLDRIEHFVLAHELTHAIDDQFFDLDTLDDMAVRCQDEAIQAALGVVEGSANHFATQVLLRFPVATTGDVPSGDTSEVPPFILELQAYPYTIGQRFVDALADEGGTEAINEALRTYPTTTEQIFHPSKYPDDVAQDVDVPDFAPTFGEDWRDLNVMVVGELWLRAMLHLGSVLDDARAEEAAAGWDGAIYRSWTNGPDVAVVLSTVWDTEEDARQFQTALDAWVAEGSSRSLVIRNGGEVHAGFATDGTAMEALSSALASL
jgi:hypothetical protein